MKSLATSDFWDSFAVLPPEVQQRARLVYRFGKRDPRHPSLHFKKINEVWSVRIGSEYRALAILDEDTYHWFWIGPHNEYQRLLKA